MKLTANELKVLKAIDDSEYGDALTDAIWTWSVMDHAGFPSKRSAGGVVASLSKKGLINADPDSGNGEDDACITITETGAVAYIAAVGAENVRKSIPTSISTRSNTMNTQVAAETVQPKKARAPYGSKKATTKPVKAGSAKATKDAKATKPAKAKPAKVAATKDDSVKSTDALRKAAAERYERDTEHKTAGGNVSVNNGDEVAHKLLGKDLDAVYAMAAKTLKEDEADLRAKYKHLNIGMQRMALGNRMRAALK